MAKNPKLHAAVSAAKEAIWPTYMAAIGIKELTEPNSEDRKSFEAFNTAMGTAISHLNDLIYRASGEDDEDDPDAGLD